MENLVTMAKYAQRQNYGLFLGHFGVEFFPGFFLNKSAQAPQKTSDKFLLSLFSRFRKKFKKYKMALRTFSGTLLRNLAKIVFFPVEIMN